MADIAAVPSNMTTIADAIAAGERTSQPQQAVRGTGATGAFDGMGSEAFMKLLTAQMRYQNPMAPKDGTEYLSQISQYAVVEQLQKLTKAQDELGSYQRMLLATNMVGRQVTGTNEAGVIVTGTARQVELRDGKPLVVTDKGKIAFDKVDTVETTPPAPAPTT